MKKQIIFSGYSSEIQTFYAGLKENNNKEWFSEKKEFYENEIKAPSKLLLEELAIRFMELDVPYRYDTRKSMFRINRDIRFSANKDPYKTNLGVYLPYSDIHDKILIPDTVGLYFHIDPDSCFIAGGLHGPTPNALKATREAIETHGSDLVKIISDKKFKTEFPSVFESESLKRNPRGIPEGHPHSDLLRLKEHIFYSNINIKSSTTHELVELMINKGRAAAAFLEFFEKGFLEFQHNQ